MAGIIAEVAREVREGGRRLDRKLFETVEATFQIAAESVSALDILGAPWRAVLVDGPLWLDFIYAPGCHGHQSAEDWLQEERARADDSFGSFLRTVRNIMEHGQKAYFGARARTGVERYESVCAMLGLSKEHMGPPSWPPHVLYSMSTKLAAATGVPLPTMLQRIRGGLEQIAKGLEEFEAALRESGSLPYFFNIIRRRPGELSAEQKTAAAMALVAGYPQARPE